MPEFWRIAFGALQYRKLMVLALIAALLDGAFAFAGFGSMLLVIKQLLGDNQNVRDLVSHVLTHPTVARVAGPPGPWLDYVPTDPFLGFGFMLLLIFILASLGGVARYAHQSLVITITLRTAMRLRRQVYDRLIRGPMSVLLAKGTADHLSRVTRDCTLVTRGLQALMGKTVQSVITGMVALSLATIANWKLTALFLLMLPVNYKLIRRFGKTVRRAAKNTNRQYGDMTRSLQESLQALPVVKVHQAEGYERRRFSKISRRVLGHEMHSRTAKALSGPLVELVAIFGTMMVALVAAYLVYNRPGAATREELVQVLVLLGMAGVAFKPLTGLNNDLQEAAGSAIRIDEALKLPVEPTSKQQRHLPRLPRHSQSVVFESASYAYPGSEREAISDVDLDVRHGLSVAIVGPNGSGKSTLLSLLPRLLEPTRGRILIDGKDISEVSLRSLRRQIAMVTQQSVLFEGTIAENIAYGRRHESMDRIIAAAKQAYADEFIRALPRGYDSVLGEYGSGLSGGQRQRLCIARAILRDPSILILDEATSQIDAESEAGITQALRQFRHGRTTFTIAHRLSTVIDADLIVVMNHGRIVDMDRHDALLKRCAVYKLLTQTQLTAAAG